MAIRFGTSGWRAIIADEFNFVNVGLVTKAICSYLNKISSENRATLIVGHDSRFMGENFAGFAAEIAKQKGFRVLLCTSPTPTPTISHTIRSQRAVGGINFTASHNPPEYQGIKFSTADGAPALPKITKQIEEYIQNKSEVELAAEAVAVRGTSLTEQLNELYDRVGKLESGRIGVKLTDEVAKSLKEKLAQEPSEIAGRKIEKINRIDGVKFIFTDGSWMLMRPSGTEPLVRIYAESEKREDLEVLLEQGRSYLLG